MKTADPDIDIRVEDKKISDAPPAGSSLIGFTRDDDRAVFDPDFGYLVKTERDDVYYSAVYGFVTLKKS